MNVRRTTWGLVLATAAVWAVFFVWALTVVFSPAVAQTVSLLTLPWVKVADEGMGFSVPVDTPARFGVADQWVYKTVRGLVVCDLNTFGSDPAFNVLKVCETQRVEQPPVAPPDTPPPASPPGAGCLPDQFGGQPLLYSQGQTGAGAWVHGWCRTRYGWSGWTRITEPGFTGDALAAWLNEARGAGVGLAWGAMWHERNPPFDAPTDGLMRAVAAQLITVPVPVPTLARPAMVTPASTSKDGKRAAYTSALVLAKTRVSAGLPCDCIAGRLAKGDISYCAVTPSPLMAVCVVAP